MDIAYVNDTSIIRQNPRATAINSAIEIDLTGQVCADSIGTYPYSGIGGQMDFMRGASLSEDGKPIKGVVDGAIVDNNVNRNPSLVLKGGIDKQLANNIPGNILFK